VEGIVKLRSVGRARRVLLARHARFALLRRTILPEIFLFDFANGQDAATVLSSVDAGDTIPSSRKEKGSGPPV
jgi:hypothetical protein